VVAETLAQGLGDLGTQHNPSDPQLVAGLRVMLEEVQVDHPVGLVGGHAGRKPVVARSDVRRLGAVLCILSHEGSLALALLFVKSAT
jgi:hypothetical protein